MTALDLLKQLHDLGITPVPYPDGTLHCRASKGLLTQVLVERMREHKAELHGLVEAWSERAAITQYCGGLAREDADRLAWGCVLASHAGCAACGYPDAAGVTNDA
jgi:hypothetical protein